MTLPWRRGGMSAQAIREARSAWISRLFPKRFLWPLARPATIPRERAAETAKGNLLTMTEGDNRAPLFNIGTQPPRQYLHLNLCLFLIPIQLGRITSSVLGLGPPIVCEGQIREFDGCCRLGRTRTRRDSQQDAKQHKGSHPFHGSR